MQQKQHQLYYLYITKSNDSFHSVLGRFVRITRSCEKPERQTFFYFRLFCIFLMTELKLHKHSCHINKHIYIHNENFGFCMRVSTLIFEDNYICSRLILTVENIKKMK